MSASAKSNEQFVREQRRHLRKRMSRSIEFAIAGRARTFGVCLNLGLGGMQIDTAEPGEFGDRITVYLELEGLDGETALPGVVRWSKPGVMGVQFDSHGVRVTYALLRLLAGP